ncbi:glutathione ABC transporter permease GsiD [Gluconacetobacter liquefaciens]|nr:oligopeptide ABC transporter permease [Gluconacetobacter liquefaciens NRIC 0522]GEB36308.1 glutathione ABC transporter permease GsiD [Gluconacetobacter liquefaciens]
MAMLQDLAGILRRSGATTRVALAVVCGLGIVALAGPWVVAADPYGIDLHHALQGPGWRAPLGTDELGRGILGRLIAGLRLTLALGLASVAIGGSAGLALGLAAAYYPRADQWIMRVLDVVLSFPTILFGLAIVAICGPGAEAVVTSLALSTMPLTARMIRATAGIEMVRDYVEAARSLGMSDRRLMWRHVMPNCLSTLIVFSTLRFGQVVLMGSILSFVGLGTQPPVAELGTMVAEGRNFLFYAPHVAILPALLIFIIVLACNLLGDSLRDVVDRRGS